MVSMSFWISCIFLVCSYNTFLRSLSFTFSWVLASSICLLIAAFLVISYLFSSFKDMNLFWRSIISVKPSVNPSVFLSLSLSSVVHMLCRKSEKSLCFSRSFCFSWSWISVSAFYLSSCSIAAFFRSISFFSFASFSSSVLVFREKVERRAVYSVTSWIIYCWSLLYCCLWASSSLALVMISSFFVVKFSSVSLSSLSFCKRRTAWRGLWPKIKLKLVISNKSLVF